MQLEPIWIYRVLSDLKELSKSPEFIRLTLTSYSETTKNDIMREVYLRFIKLNDEELLKACPMIHLRFQGPGDISIPVPHCQMFKYLTGYQMTLKNKLNISRSLLTQKMLS